MLTTSRMTHCSSFDDFKFFKGVQIPQIILSLVPMLCEFLRLAPPRLKCPSKRAPPLLLAHSWGGPSGTVELSQTSPFTCIFSWSCEFFQGLAALFFVFAEVMRSTVPFSQASLPSLLLTAHPLPQTDSNWSPSRVVTCFHDCSVM